MKLVLKFNKTHIFYWVIYMYKLKKLPYLFESLEPYIDTHTLGLHYNKHQKNYLKKLNQLLQNNNYNYEYPIELLSYHLNEFKEEDRNNILFNLGGVLNHTIYFESLSNKHEMPSNELLNKILDNFNSLDNFKTLFKESAMNLKGSGYTYLILDQDNNLQIMNFTNQDCPCFHNLIPLLCIDLWEHAYYINYENNKDLYIDNFFDIIDFNYANKLYDHIIKI